MGTLTFEALLLVYLTGAALFYSYLEATAAPDPTSETRVGTRPMAV